MMRLTLHSHPLPDGRNADLTFTVGDGAATYEHGHAFEPEGCVTVTHSDLRAFGVWWFDETHRRAVAEAERVMGRRAA